jgi:3-dehydroquinate synthetase
MRTHNFGFACIVYRRSTTYVSVPTTLTGLIDASVFNRAAVIWAGVKNRLGHEPIDTTINSSSLRSLNEADICNGTTEIIRITSCTDAATFELIQMHGEDLIRTKLSETNIIGLATVEAQHIADPVFRKG